MDDTIARQKLNRKIIFVTGEAFDDGATRKSSDDGSVARIQIAVGKDDCIADGLRRTAARINGEIGGEESTLAMNHMTLRTGTFAEKDFSPMPRIPLQCHGRRIALQYPQVIDEGVKHILTQVVEGRHGSLINTFSKDFKKLRVRELADLGSRDDVRSALTAPSVEAVAARAVGRESSLTLLLCCILTYALT